MLSIVAKSGSWTAQPALSLRSLSDAFAREKPAWCLDAPAPRHSSSCNSATTQVNTKEWQRITGDILGAAVGEESRRQDRQSKGDGARARAEGKVMVGRTERLRAKDSGETVSPQMLS